jgi:hypothetical protein
VLILKGLGSPRSEKRRQAAALQKEAHSYLVGIVARKVRAVKRDLQSGTVAESIFDGREAAPEEPACDYKNGRRKPNPEEFALKNFQTAVAEK